MVRLVSGEVVVGNRCGKELRRMKPTSNYHISMHIRPICTTADSDHGILKQQDSPGTWSFLWTPQGACEWHSIPREIQECVLGVHPLTLYILVYLSRFGWALRVAKYTAKRLLSIISDKDHIAFYTYNETTNSLSCKEDLERARLKYINYLTDQIDSIEAYGK